MASRVAALSAALALALAAWAALDPARGGIATLLAAVAVLAAGFAWLEGGTLSARDLTLVATLGGLQPGAYVLMAKTNQSSNARTEGRCRLQAGDQYDDSNRGLRPEGTPEAHALQLVHSFSGPGTVVLSCRSPAGNWGASDSKIIAIRVAAASTNVVSG